MSGPQVAFVELLLAAMKDAAIEKKLTQLKTQLDPWEGKRGKNQLRTVRIIVIPEAMDFDFPSYAPLGTPQG